MKLVYAVTIDVPIGRVGEPFPSGEAFPSESQMAEAVCEGLHLLGFPALEVTARREHA